MAKMKKGRGWTSKPTPAERQGTLARLLALETILETDGGKRSFIDEAIEPRLARPELEDRDRHLLQEIAYGAVRHRNTLDHLLDRHVRFAMKRQEPAVRWSLRLGAYQLVYLTRIPPHAAIDRTLEALKSWPDIGARAIGFANAVLRKLAAEIQRKDAAPPEAAHDPSVLPVRYGYCHFRDPILPLFNMDPLGHLSLKHSLPRWLVSSWREKHGEEEAEVICGASNRIPLVTVRITARAPERAELLRSLEAAGVEAEPAGETSLVLKRTGDPRRLEALQKGWVQVQDPTATAIGRVLSPPPGARVLDLCAAPGGKAAQLLEQLGPDGELVACDVDDEKLARLKETLERAGERGFTLRRVSDDPEKVDLGEKFPFVLIDAPCSNTGVLARRPEARWRVHAEDLAQLAELQKRLLSAAARHLAVGGRLVYATCSIQPEENEAVATWAVESLPGLVKLEDRYFLPRLEGGDGGYFALFERHADGP